MSPLGVIVLIVLMDLLGFSIVMPLLAPFGQHYGFSGGQIGLLYAAYPMCQLVAGPILGRLSDRYGGRPLLIVSQGGAGVSVFVLGVFGGLTRVLVAPGIGAASGGDKLAGAAPAGR